MRWLIACTAAALAAAPSFAAGPDYLDHLLKGRVAESPRRCIFPDRTAQPEIIDGTALVFHDARYTYVARFKHGCPALREDRRVNVRGAGGEICENDPVRVSEMTGHDFGMCTFETFVPYKRK